MNKRSYPFSNLTKIEMDAIIDRARQERAEVLAAAFVWLGRVLGAVLVTPIVRLWSAARPAAPISRALHR